MAKRANNKSCNGDTRVNCVGSHTYINDWRDNQQMDGKTSWLTVVVIGTKLRTTWASHTHTHEGGTSQIQGPKPGKQIRQVSDSNSSSSSSCVSPQTTAIMMANFSLHEPSAWSQSCRCRCRWHKVEWVLSIKSSGHGQWQRLMVMMVEVWVKFADEEMMKLPLLALKLSLRPRLGLGLTLRLKLCLRQTCFNVSKANI